MLNMARRERFILMEEEKKEVDVIPAAELVQEPLPLDLDMGVEAPIEEQPIPEEVKVNAFSGLVNASITREWENIDALNSAISTFTSERPEDLSSIEILKQLVEEKTAHIGMLQKVLGIVDGKTYELVKDGEEKAEEIVSEVVPEVKEEPKLEESKKPLKEDMTDDYWSAVVEGEVDFLVQDEDSIALLDNEEAQDILLGLDEEQIKKMSIEVGSYILNADNVWEEVTSVIRGGITYWIKKNIINNPETLSQITPDESELESLKKPLLKEDMSDLEEIGDLPEFNSDGFYNQIALSAITHLLNRIEDEDFDIIDEQDEIVAAVLPSLNKQELIEIIKEASGNLSSIPDDAYDYIFDEAYESVKELLVKKADTVKGLRVPLDVEEENPKTDKEGE
jgi:hypothetical protein